MYPKDYFRQAYRLNQRINSNIAEVEQLRIMAASITASTMEEKVKHSCNGDAPFVRSIEKIVELEKTINKEIDRFVDLKHEMHSVIEAVTNADERMVLRYRYIQNYTWEEISEALHADKSTIRRWHTNALAHVILPENPTII